MKASRLLRLCVLYLLALAIVVLCAALHCTACAETRTLQPRGRGLVRSRELREKRLAVLAARWRDVAA